MIAFEVPGEPIAFARTRMNHAGFRFNPTKQSNYARLVKAKAEKVMANVAMFEGPVSISVRAEFLYPASWSAKKCANTRWKTSKPDADNLLKIVKDALNKIVYRDDAQVVDARVQKIYSSIRPRLVVEVSFVDDLTS